MKGSSRRSCDKAGRDVDDGRHQASMKGSSRRSCDSAAHRRCQGVAASLNEGQLPEELRLLGVLPARRWLRLNEGQLPEELRQGPDITHTELGFGTAAAKGAVRPLPRPAAA